MEENKYRELSIKIVKAIEETTNDYDAIDIVEKILKEEKIYEEKN